MRDAWKKQRYNRDQKRRAAKNGAAALWPRYRSDPIFKNSLDQKLKVSRSRGGAKSLPSIGERAFEKRLTATASSHSRPTYYDSSGNQLRSLLELRIAQTLQTNGIPYVVEPHLVVPDHAFYPDFVLANGQKIIEAVGYAADWYRDKTTEKIKLIVKSHGHIHEAIVTPFLRIMTRKLEGVPRVTLFSPYQLEQTVHWCRGMPGFTTL